MPSFLKKVWNEVTFHHPRHKNESPTPVNRTVYVAPVIYQQPRIINIINNETTKAKNDLFFRAMVRKELNVNLPVELLEILCQTLGH